MGDDPGLAVSIRRIARSLETAARGLELGEIAAGAMAIQRGADAQLARSVSNFLALIDELRDEAPGGVAVVQPGMILNPRYGRIGMGAALAVAFALGISLSFAAVGLEELSVRRHPRMRDLATLLVVAVIENVGYRPAASKARGDRRPEEIERVRRSRT